MSRFFLIAGCLLYTVAATAADKKAVKLATLEQFAFEPGGVIEIRDSFGEVTVEGWDQPDIEISTVRKTRKTYTDRERPRAIEELDKIVVTPVKEEGNRFVISTDFPSRNLFTRPLRGKTNLELEYRIKVPMQSAVHIKHEIGEVKVRNVRGDIRVTSTIGEISLRLPEEENYRVDARTRIGDVNSDWGFGLDGGKAHEVYLRVGIGEINVRKQPSPPQRPLTD